MSRGMLVHEPLSRTFDAEDEIVIHTWKPNLDGSVTVEGGVNVYKDGHSWGRALVRLRLQPDGPDAAKWARAERRREKEQS